MQANRFILLVFVYFYDKINTYIFNVFYKICRERLNKLE